MTNLTPGQVTAVEQIFKKATATLMDLVNELQRKVETLEQKNKEQEDKIKELQQQKSEGTAAEITNEKITFAALFKKSSDSHLKLLNVVSDENKQRNKKEKNVIVFGLTESKKVNITDKKDDDMNEIKQICEILEVENEVEAIFRINSKDQGKPKPLVMVLKDKEARNKILQAAKKLKGSDDYKSVFLGPDLTEAQRLKYKELVALRNRKNEEMAPEEKTKKIYCIRDNAVVLLNKRNK
jgi:hypothetical protein